MTMSGGMALQMETARQWEDVTGGTIYEAYGLTKASPAVTLSTITHNHLGAVGKLLPATKI
ncbi:AMP-binding protein [Parendozoicomonas callyspongiae]|uniref:AMP-binding protein n=1 Tax=Parendozoicomonas callyspongiae TaxID=2942213 RepID=UPI002FCCB8DD